MSRIYSSGKTTFKMKDGSQVNLCTDLDIDDILPKIQWVIKNPGKKIMQLMNFLTYFRSTVAYWIVSSN